MENYPVVVKCEDVYVAVPIYTLIQESPIFKSMFDVQIKRSRPKITNYDSSSISNSGDTLKHLSEAERNEETRESEYSEWNWRSWPRYILSQITDRLHSSKNNGNENEKMAGNSLFKDNEPKPEFEEAQVDMITISGYRKNSVEKLFMYLKGHKEFLNNCCDISVLLDILSICHKYAITSPVPALIQKIESKSVTMENLILVLETSEGLHDIDPSLAAELYNRCLAYARSNFTSCHSLIDFLLKNVGSFDHVLQLYKALRNDDHVVIRRNVPTSNRSVISKNVPTYIVKNLKWTVVCQTNRVNDTETLGVYIEVENPISKMSSYSSWSCTANIHLRIWNESEGTFQGQQFQCTFSPELTRKGFDDFKSLAETVHPSNGCLKNGFLVVEAEIKIQEVIGVQDCLGVKEDQLIWLDEFQEASDFSYTRELQPEHTEQDQESDPCVLLMCEDVPVVIHESCLVKESQYFEARLSKHWKRDDKTFCENSDSKKLSLTRSFQISGFNPQSSKILFEQLKGYTAMMEKCQSFDLLTEMLRICDFYAIFKPIPLITDKINKLPINIYNLVDAFESGEKLAVIEMYRAVSHDLLMRCAAFAGGNLVSWQACISFVVDNSCNRNAVVNIFKLISEQQKCSIRCRFSNIESLKGKGDRSPDCMRGGLIWSVNILKQLRPKERSHVYEEYLTGYLCFGSPSRHPSVTSSCVVKNLSFSVYNHSNGSSHVTEKLHEDEIRFSKERLEQGLWLIPWTQVVNSNDGFNKDDEILVEVNFEIVEKNVATLDSVRISEDLIR